jgi:uncharacterized membrane-anchored protein YhcB (DUF1043 family)
MLFRLTLKAVRIEALLLQLVYRSKFIMATQKDLQDAIQQLKDDVATEAAQAAALLKDLGDQIQALKDQLAAGTNVTSADLDALVASVKGVDASVADIVPPGAVAPAGGGGPGEEHP